MFVYDLIEELCIKNGITVTDLCRNCAIPRSTLTDYKKGRVKKLSLDTVSKISDYFGVSMSYLCGKNMEAPTEEALKAYLFGEGTVVTDKMWQEVKDYALFVKQKYVK